MKETWKSIPGCSEIYQVSDKGGVRKIPHYGKHSSGKREFRGFRYLKGYIRKTGYRYVELQGRPYGIHRLVCAAFHGLDLNNPKLYACHKNDIRDDNRSDNLFIGTAQDNTNDCIRKGRHNYSNKTSFKRGGSHANSKLNEGDVKEIKQKIKDGVKLTKLAEEYEVKYSTIYSIKSGSRWGWL